MNSILRKTLLATAIAAFISAPVWAADHAADRNDNMPQTDSEVTVESFPDSATPEAPVTDHPLYALTPNDLVNRDVLDIKGAKIGSVSAVVMGADSTTAHAVIASGGLLGFRERETAIELNQVELAGEAVQISVTQDELEAHDEYMPELYLELAPERPISEFLVLVPAPE